MSRSSHSLAILGPEIHKKLPQTRVLIVGAGGIGCELVKNIVLAGFGDITLLDLDTIDLSNLNRQFLFRKKDVKQSKALVAARTVSAFNPACQITPIHGNIKEAEYDVTWFKSFHIVLSALDNLDARRHVNRMCIAAGTPLIESGTAGYLGQVQPLVKDVTECFDCVPKPVPKSFPVCTIRSTPSTPIHCIVWAKSYLFPQLFGEDEDDSSELDAAVAAGENAAEIDNLKKEASAFKVVRQSMLSSKSSEAASSSVFHKIFTADIERLLTMSDMWRSRKPPTPLQRDSILNETFSLAAARKESNGKASVNGSNGSPHDGNKLKDQRELSLRDNVLLFDSSLQRLADRLKLGEEGRALSFDKDDDDALGFVTAAANLRAWAYGIPSLTRWEVKEMAGNIIPAIATTNAIISGLIVLQALHVLRTHPPAEAPPDAQTNRQLQARNIFIQSGRPAAPLGAFPTSTPNAHCSVCRDTYLHIQCDPSRVTLGALLNAVLSAEATNSGRDGKRDVSVYEAGRVLSDPDWDDNLGRTLEDLSCGRGKFITVVDDEETVGNFVFAISRLPVTHSPESVPYILPEYIDSPPPRPPPVPASPPSSPVKPIRSPVKKSAKKRTAPDDEIDVLETPFQATKKRLKTAHAVNGATLDGGDDDIQIIEVRNGMDVSVEMQEARELEEEGLVIVDRPINF